MSPDQLKAEISCFMGGLEDRYKHSLGGFIYTPGIKFLADKAECYWLLDAIGSFQLTSKVNQHQFQSWTLKVREDQTATLTMTDGNSKRPLVQQEIPFTTFPIIGETSVWLIDRVLILPSEY